MGRYDPPCVRCIDSELTCADSSHFQLDAFTRFDRAARSIIDADRNLYGGRHARQLEQIFAKRKVKGFRRKR